LGEVERSDTTIIRSPRLPCIANLKGHIAALAAFRLFIGIHINIGIPICLRTPPNDTHFKGAKTTQTTYGEQHPHRGNPFAWAAFAVVLVAVVAFLAILATHGYPSVPAGTYYGYPPFGWWFFFPFGIFFLFIILLFVSRLIFWPMGWGRRRYWYGYGYGNASEIVRQRYARGEITKEQFEQMKKDLEQH